MQTTISSLATSGMCPRLRMRGSRRWRTPILSTTSNVADLDKIRWHRVLSIHLMSWFLNQWVNSTTKTVRTSWSSRKVSKSNRPKKINHLNLGSFWVWRQRSKMKRVALNKKDHSYFRCPGALSNLILIDRNSQVFQNSLLLCCSKDWQRCKKWRKR